MSFTEASLHRSAEAMPLLIRACGVSDSAAALVARGLCVVRAVHRDGLSVSQPGHPDAVYVGVAGSGLLPLHVVVRRRVLAPVVAHAARLRCDGGTVPGLQFDLAGARRFSLRSHPDAGGPRERGAALALDRVAAWLCTQPRPSGLGEPVAAILAAGGRWRQALAARGSGGTDEVRTLIGRGIGATPAGDDMLVGALALAWARAGQADALVSRVGAFAGEFDRLTTPASATYLRAALRGEFGSHLLSFIRALRFATTDRVLACARRVASHGSTSGIDTLVGTVLAAGDE